MKSFKSSFKSPVWRQKLSDWQELHKTNSSTDFMSTILHTKYGETQVLSTQTEPSRPHLVFLPGFRTCGLYWDICDGLTIYKDQYQVHLVDVIGQPSLSSGTTPLVKGLGYGEWLVEVLDALGIEKAAFAGASFGGQLIMKLSQVAPQRISKAFLCNPGGLTNVRLKGILANIPIMLYGSDRNIEKMMQKVALGKKHGLNENQYQSLLQNIIISVRGFKNGAQFPYPMRAEELQGMTAPTYLMLGTDDLMFNYKKQIQRAEKLLPNLVGIELFENIGHGIEIEPALHEGILKLLQIDG